MFSAQEPLVSIITLNFNQTAVTCEFLESTRKLAYTNYEVLVCDMASDIDPAPRIAAGNYPKTTLHASKQNLGFAAGNNWGMRRAKGDFIFIVNNDTELSPFVIHKLLKPFFSDPAIGVTSPKIRLFDDPGTIQYAGFRPMNRFTGRTATIGEMEKDRGQYDVSRPTAAAHGCAMMVKRAVIGKTGMFAEKFFLYYEEWDWSARILKAGFTIWYVADAVVYHKGSMTVGKHNPAKVYYLTRNRILYMRRNAGRFHLAVFSLFFMVFTFPRSVVRYAVRGQFVHLKLFFRGVLWNVVHSGSSAV